MTHRDAFDELADRFGTNLDRANARHRARRRPRVRRIAIAGTGLAIAGTVAALVIGIGAGDDSPVDFVSQARAALAPRSEPTILHIATGTPWSNGPQPNMVTNTELWSATDPPRWRMVQGITRTDGKRLAPQLQRHAAPEEFSYAHGVGNDLRFGTLHRVTGYTDDGPGATLPLPWLRPKDGDPIATLRDMLSRGKVTDTGAATVDGHAVRKLVAITPRTERQPGQRVEYDVDSSTFAPVRLSVKLIPALDWNHKGLRYALASTPIVVHITKFERIPMTPANQALLSIKVPAGTPVRTKSVAGMQAARAREIRTCHTNSSGVRVCKARTR